MYNVIYNRSFSEINVYETLESNGIQMRLKTPVNAVHVNMVTQGRTKIRRMDGQMDEAREEVGYRDDLYE